ncbi:MAG: helix-turn-helix domain-containing protein [Actinomycetota bacterium]
MSAHTALPPPDQDETVIGITEAATMLDCSAAHARRLASRGELPGLIGTLGRGYKVHRGALRLWIARGLEQVTA